MAKKKKDDDRKIVSSQRTGEDKFEVEHEDGSRFEMTTEDCKPGVKQNIFDTIRKERTDTGHGLLFSMGAYIDKNGKVIRCDE